MKLIDFPIERINEYLESHIFEVVTSPTHSDDNNVKTNVRVKLTGVKNYITVGENMPHVEYTLYILPSNKESDMWSSLHAKVYGNKVYINTISQEYSQIRWVTNHLLSDLLKYFGVEMNTICTKVINEVEPMKLNENLIKEGKYDSVVRTIVRDVLTIFKKHGEGDYGLPEDLRKDEVYYEFPQLMNPIQVFVDMSFDESVEGFDADADYYNDEDLIYVTIVSNPKFGTSFLYELVGELNELISHELEHVKQHEKGYEFPKREPKDPLKYYTQKHEIDAQRAGFKRQSKLGKLDYETVVRNWFENNKHKHNLPKDKAEIVIQRILSEK
jgi:hypothetical protein